MNTADDDLLLFLLQIGSVCQKYQMWMHVDAAYAGSAFLVWTDSVNRHAYIDFNRLIFPSSSPSLHLADAMSPVSRVSRLAERHPKGRFDCIQSIEMVDGAL